MNSVQIVRSRRKTVAIQVHPNGQVILRLPWKFPKARIPEILEQYQGWIEEQVQKFYAQRQQVSEHKFIEGETFWYLGKEYPLHIIEQTTQPLWWNKEGFWLDKNSRDHARELFLAWYQEQAISYFTARARQFEKQFTDQPYQIKLSNAQTRWGTCGSRRIIRLAWRVIMAPPQVIDNVIVHELAHFVHSNHSKAFWQAVASVCPDYKQARAWLRNFGHLLTI